jgi:hypothetical protein
VENEPTVAVKVLVQPDAGGSEVSGRRRVQVFYLIRSERQLCE